MPSHVGNIHDQLGSCFGLIVPGHLLDLVGSGVALSWALRMVPDVSKIFEDRQPVRVLYLLDALSCDSGQLLPFRRAARQSVAMFSHHDLRASFSRGRAGSLVTLRSAPRFSLSAELPREAARALS